MKSLSFSKPIGLSMSEVFPRIKNANVNVCKYCIYYKPDVSILSTYTSSFAKCAKFGEKNIVNGTIHYDYADDCRYIERKCGKEGKHFEPEPNLEWKMWKHAFQSNRLVIFLWSFIFTSAGSVIYKSNI